MSEVRFLPNPNNSEYTHISLGSGHSCCVYAVSPVDKQPGTVLHQRFHEAAISKGCKLVGLGGHQEAEPTGAGKLELIRNAIEVIVERNAADDLDGTGRPTLKALKAQAGFNVTKGEADAAWAEFVAGLED
ncbi:MAG: hypothetical protein NDI93_00540 [Pseudomonas sp.]|nr:hypothetical protein [Pseudomonas sp.]